MLIYLDAVMLLNFLVDLFLILGTNRLTGYPPEIRRAAPAAALGSLYAGICLIPQWRFLGNTAWRIVCMGFLTATAFGISGSALRRGAVFFLLSMALGGIASGFGAANFVTLFLCAILLWLLCCAGFAGDSGTKRYVPVELNWQGKRLRLLALKDTGNTLRDPITGEQVLVCGADVGEELLGLDRKRFQDPAEIAAAGVIAGARLIPYCTVSQPAGLLLAVRMKDVKIGKHTQNPLVAFAPFEIAKGEAYRMLTGGMV